MALGHISESTKHAVDAVSIVTVVGTLAQWLPAMAALFTIIWTFIRILETKTVSDIINKFKNIKNNDL